MRMKINACVGLLSTNVQSMLKIKCNIFYGLGLGLKIPNEFPTKNNINSNFVLNDIIQYTAISWSTCTLLRIMLLFVCKK